MGCVVYGRRRTIRRLEHAPLSTRPCLMPMQGVWTCVTARGRHVKVRDEHRREHAGWKALRLMRMSICSDPGGSQRGHVNGSIVNTVLCARAGQDPARIATVCSGRRVVCVRHRHPLSSLMVLL
jgi:hypothetical protein